MDSNFFGEIEDFLESFGSPGGGSSKENSKPREKRKLEEEPSPGGGTLESPSSYGELPKSAKLEDPEARSTPTTLLAQALTEKRPLSNPPPVANNSILDPVSGAISKEDHIFEEDKNTRGGLKTNPNVNRLLNQLQSSKPKKEPAFPFDLESPNKEDFLPFEQQTAHQGPPMMMRPNGAVYNKGGHPRRQMNNGYGGPPPAQQQHYNHDMANNWDYGKGPMYNPGQQQPMRPMMMRQDFNNGRGMNGFPPEFGMGPRGAFPPNYRGGNMAGGGNMYRRMPGGYNGSYAPQQQQQPYQHHADGYNYNGGMEGAEGGFMHQGNRMNYGPAGTIPQPSGSPRNMRYDYDFPANRFAGGNHYPANAGFPQQQRPYRGGHLSGGGHHPPRAGYNGNTMNCFPGEEVPYESADFAQQAVLASPPHLNPKQQQVQQQTDYDSWKVNAAEMRKGLLENLVKALGPEQSGVAEQVELEAFNTSPSKEAYYQRLAEWLAGVFSQQQQTTTQEEPPIKSPSASPPNAANSSSNQNSIPDSSNQWSDPAGGGDVSSTELLDGVLQLDSSEESKGGSSAPTPSSNNEGGSDSGGVNASSSSKSQVHPILSSLLPVSSSNNNTSSSNNNSGGGKSVVDELFSGSSSPSLESSGPGGGSSSEGSFQSPLSLSSPTSAAAATNGTPRRPPCSSNGAATNSSNNSTNILNNPHSVDSGIGSPRSITSSSLYSPKIPQGTSPSLIPNSENSPDK